MVEEHELRATITDATDERRDARVRHRRRRQYSWIDAPPPTMRPSNRSRVHSRVTKMGHRFDASRDGPGPARLRAPRRDRSPCRSRRHRQQRDHPPSSTTLSRRGPNTRKPPVSTLDRSVENVHHRRHHRPRVLGCQLERSPRPDPKRELAFNDDRVIGSEFRPTAEQGALLCVRIA